MPDEKRTREAMPSKELVLAAIERAERHRIRHSDPDLHHDQSNQPGVLFATVKEHLGLAAAGWTTIRLRPTWDELEAAGLIQQARIRGRAVWTLTTAGQQQLDAIRSSGGLGALPESPQHRRWREAHDIAGKRIGEFREHLRRVLREAIGVLDAHDQPDSDGWYAQSQRIRDAYERLESASYCLNEWHEPDDSRADIAPRWRAGRRDIRRYEKD
jgi:DNA-binding PadR family transcriptional regulator